MRARVLMAGIGVGGGSGCPSSSSGNKPAGAPHAPSRQQDVITEAEIADRAADAANALQIVQKLRPQMLRSRGRFSPADSSDAGALPRIAVDGVAYGSIDNLVNLNAMSVREIRYLNATDA